MATRRERVVLELEDQFTSKAARIIAETQLMRKEIDSLNTVSTRSNGVAKVSKDIDGLSASAVKGSKEIDRYSGRLRLFADIALILGPAAVTVGAGLGGMAVSAGVAGLALYGLGNTFKALNKYQLEPTTENLVALNEELIKAGPAGAAFVTYLDSLGPKLHDLQLVARAGFLPGLQEGIESVMTRFPEVRDIVADLADELGDLASRGGEWLAGPGFKHFQDFLAYAHQVGPEVGDFLGALTSALVGIARAAAPVGEVTLPILTDLLKVMAAIANSPLGPALLGTASAFAIVSRSTALAEGALARLSGTSAATAKNLAAVGKGVEFGALLVSINLLDKAFDNLLNTRVDESALGRNLQALAGGEFKGNLDQIAHDLVAVNSAILGTGDKFLGKLPGIGLDDQKNNIKAVDDALAQMVESGNADTAAMAFQHLKLSAEELGVSAHDITKQFPQYATAVKNAKDATNQYGSSLVAATPPTKTFAEVVRDATQAMQDQRTAALGAFDAETQYRQALKDAAAQAKTNNAGIKGNSDAALANREALSRLAAAWNGSSDAVKNNVGRFHEARAAFIKTAEDMGVPRAAAKRLARQLLDIPESVVTRTAVETGQASRALAALKAKLDQLDGYTAHTFVQVGVKGKLAGMAADRSADGSTVPKTGLPYADRHLYLLADGEEVISNRFGQADRHRSLLKAINAGRLATGGTAGVDGFVSNPASPYMVANSLGVDIDRDDRLKRRLRLFGLALDKAKTSLENETSARDSLKASITSSLTGGLFESGATSAFSGGFAAGSIGAVNAKLQQQIRDANEQTALEKQLRARGVSGDALLAVIEDGGLASLRSFAASSNSTLADYQRLFGQRGAAVETTANTAASVLGMTAEIGKERAEIASLHQTVKSLQKQLDAAEKRARRDRRDTPAKTGKAVAHAHDKSAKNARTR